MTRRAASGRSPIRLVAVAAALVVVAVAGTLARPGAASAHALLRASTPARGATVGTAPAAITLTFSEPPDLALTSVKVLDTGGGDHVTGPPVAVADSPASISVPIGTLADGVYTVSWRTVSSVDGHISAGSFAFGVGVAPPSGPPDAGGGEGQAGTPPAIGARWILYLGLLALLGAAFVALAVVRRPSPDLLALAAAGWLLTAIGTIGVVAVQWLDTGAPLEALPGTSIGAAALARGVALAAVGISLGVLALRESGADRPGWALVALASTAALVVDVATGHAAAGAGWLVQVAIQSAHGLAAGAWLGGLMALLVALRRTPSEERVELARRFSSWAGYALVLVAVSGVARAVVEVRTLDALVTTEFGRVVLLKSALLLALAALGAFNRFVNLRNATRAMAGLRRIGGAEVAVTVAVIGLSALLVNLTPPASAGGSAPPQPPPLVALGSDFGTSIKARLTAAPGPAGANAFDLELVDYDTLEPVEALGASLRFELASQAGVEPSTLALTPTPGAPGRFEGEGASLAIDGIWRITATVERPGGGIEIPFLAATSVVPQPVTTLVEPGLPTIYQVVLEGIGFAQVYLDPDRAGPSELHVTFFSFEGTELPIDTATISAIPSAGGGVLPEPRLLEPGHFVSSVDVPAGPLAVDAISPLPPSVGTGQVHLHVTIEVQP